MVLSQGGHGRRPRETHNPLLMFPVKQISFNHREYRPSNFYTHHKHHQETILHRSTDTIQATIYLFRMITAFPRE